MQIINEESNKPRGSSPPFRELERGIDDETNGSHWVKMLSVDPQRQADRIGESLDRKLDALLPAEGGGRGENDGGKGSSRRYMSEIRNHRDMNKSQNLNVNTVSFSGIE
jgi:hypothetical protein